MISRHNLRHNRLHALFFPVSRLIQLFQFRFEPLIVHLNRLSDMNQFILCILKSFLIHQKFFEQFFTRSESSSCQDRNNFFSEFFHKTMNYCIILKNSIKKRVPDFSETLLSIIFLLFLLSYLPIQQIILFSNTFKNQFFCPHI